MHCMTRHVSRSSKIYRGHMRSLTSDDLEWMFFAPGVVFGLFSTVLTYFCSSSTPTLGSTKLCFLWSHGTHIPILSLENPRRHPWYDLIFIWSRASSGSAVSWWVLFVRYGYGPTNNNNLLLVDNNEPNITTKEQMEINIVMILMIIGVIMGIVGVYVELQQQGLKK